VVNNLDLLPIGVAYGDTGYARISPTINWVGQYCQNWPQFEADSANYKHIDCDGNGTVNSSDTDAIVLNYSLTHTRGGAGQTWRSNAPALVISMNYDTLYDSQTVVATLSLGNALNIASNVYGLAFTFNYDPLVVDSNYVSMIFTSTWLYGTGDHMALARIDSASGMIEAAVTRIDHQTRTGDGVIGQVNMKITTGNINGKDYSYYNFRCFVSNVTVIDNHGNVIPVNAGYDSAFVSYIPTGITGVGAEQAGIHIFPNPAADKLHISSDKDAISQWQIIDVMGNIVGEHQGLMGKLSTIDVSLLSAGTYVINITTGGEEVHGRFVKMGR
jgi:hypothetical protein